ncbi:MAG: HAD family phosphatase [Nocardioidaceae bacterium]|nr:HAD family phosphatase [Nocardioidaceae bacterium]
MTVKAVVFDIGGVLEMVEPIDAWLTRSAARLGVKGASFAERIRQIDPRELMGTGKLSEAEYRQRVLEAFDLDAGDADDFMAQMWDWYCGELDTELCAYAASLRPAYRTAILSNSADGARREEQRRYGFERLVDTIIYSHEVGLAKPDPRIYRLTCDLLNVQPGEMIFIDDTDDVVESARSFGIPTIHHRRTPDTIAAVNALLAGDP